MQRVRDWARPRVADRRRRRRERDDGRPRAQPAPRADRILRANPRNPRKHFSDAELDELANSIRERGIIQPIVVRRRAAPTHSRSSPASGAGARRSARRLHDVPVVVLEVSDGEALELAIIENVQRTDLNPLEEATGYQALADEFNHAQDDIAQDRRQEPQPHRQHAAAAEAVGADQSASTTRASFSRPRAHAGRPAERRGARGEIVERGLNVRQVEELARENPQRTRRKRAAPQQKDADTIALEKRLSDALGLNVSVDHRGEGGTVHIKYRDLEQLDEIMKRLERGISAALLTLFTCEKKISNCSHNYQT